MKTKRPTAASRASKSRRRAELMSSLRHRGRARKRLTWARCRASQRTAPAALVQDILPGCIRKATTMRMTRSLTLSFSPRGASQRLRPGSESATMSMARLRPRLVRFQGSGPRRGPRHFLRYQALRERGQIAQHQKLENGLDVFHTTYEARRALRLGWN